ncbi:uncharacterized protein LOC119243593 isoform X1 [Talpa occidentalis]|uniref:uncharacterized protein LOC119243593 isoform X1 n=1 Tax=Talpa occidentalis TaxID=50954 RepID=UPI0018909F90|nr:uncharacterized protein LOC119243593 isoform X1 [Talpa occidentalis]
MKAIATDSKEPVESGRQNLDTELLLLHEGTEMGHPLSEGLSPLQGHRSLVYQRHQASLRDGPWRLGGNRQGPPEPTPPPGQRVRVLAHRFLIWKQGDSKEVRSSNSSCERLVVTLSSLLSPRALRRTTSCGCMLASRRPHIHCLDLLVHINDRGAQAEGIFRKSANIKCCRVLKEKLNRGEHMNLSDESVHVVASVLKVRAVGAPLPAHSEAAGLWHVHNLPGLLELEDNLLKNTS